MARVRWCVWFGACLLAIGCAQSPQPYLEIAEEQRKASNELTEILETIKDEQSLAAAKERINDRLDAFEKIASKARALPVPSEAVRQRVAQNQFMIESSHRRLREEIARVRGLNLQGGPAFFRHFESRNQGLFSANPP
jgi:plasmid stabilization system protein ParE